MKNQFLEVKTRMGISHIKCTSITRVDVLKKGIIVHTIGGVGNFTQIIKDEKSIQEILNYIKSSNV
ncbi:hypothetical protein RI065_08490 [Mycoplasmatota bacterium zrk1]